MRHFLGVALATLALSCSSQSTNVVGTGGSAGNGGTATGGSAGSGGTAMGGAGSGGTAMGGAGGSAGSAGSTDGGGDGGQSGCETLVYDTFSGTTLDSAWVDESSSLEIVNQVVVKAKSDVLSGEAYRPISALSQYSSVVLTAKVRTVNSGDIVSVSLGNASDTDTISVALDAVNQPMVRLRQGTTPLHEWKSAALKTTYILELTYYQTGARLRVLDPNGGELHAQDVTAQPSDATKLVIRFERSAGFGPTLDDIQLLGCNGK